MHAPVVVHFKGGSLGGETRVLDKAELFGNSYRVPVSLPLSGAVIGYPSGTDPFGCPPIINYLCDEYRIERTHGSCEFDMRWVRPKDLSIELAQVKAKLADAEEALDALNKLKKWFRKN